MVKQMAKAKTTRPEVEIAAAWWADLLKAKPHNTYGKPTTDLLYSFVGEPEPMSQPAIDAFNNELVNAIEADIDPSLFTPETPIRGEVILSVDYEAGSILEQAAASAGINLNRRLPIKTIMWIRPGLVKVKRGYGAEIVEIYRADGDQSQK